jgi:hypothetical protein
MRSEFISAGHTQLRARIRRFLLTDLRQQPFATPAGASRCAFTCRGTGDTIYRRKRTYCVERLTQPGCSAITAAALIACSSSVQDELAARSGLAVGARARGGQQYFMDRMICRLRTTQGDRVAGIILCRECSRRSAWSGVWARGSPGVFTPRVSMIAAHDLTWQESLRMARRSI